MSAVTLELLEAGHDVTLVTSAPEIPFASILAPTSLPATVARQLATTPGGPSPAKKLRAYAQYRKKNVDAGMVQPKAYDVDRRATCDVLIDFLSQREQIFEEEVAWLKEERMDAVLSDATFLGW